MEQNQQNHFEENKIVGSPKNKYIIPVIIIIIVIAGGAVLYFTKGTANKNTQQIVNEVFNKLTTNNWLEYNATAGQFKVQLPKYPEINSYEVQIPNTTIKYTENDYMVEVDDYTSYYVTSAVLPAEVDISDPNKNLEGSVNGSVQSTEGNELISSQFTKYKGNPAVDYIIDNSTIGLTMYCRAVLAGNRLLILAASYEKNSYNNDDYNKFVNSLELL